MNHDAGSFRGAQIFIYNTPKCLNGSNSCHLFCFLGHGQLNQDTTIYTSHRAPIFGAINISHAPATITHVASCSDMTF